MFRILSTLCLLLCSTLGHAMIWKGTLLDADTKRGIQGATITNMLSGKITYTNSQGQFDIEGDVGDKVKFYCPGYRSEIHIILNGLQDIRLSFNMRLSSKELKEVVITQKYKTQYERDSADRHSEQDRVLARQSSNIASPFSFLAERLSRKQRAMFRFKKTFYKLEQDQFTDSRYSPALVSSLTNLGGDTLAYFMNTYKMPYEYARSATALELKMWVRFNFKDFMQKTDSMRQLTLPY